MKRTDLLDTSPEAWRRFLALLRNKTPEWRINKTFEMVDWSRSRFPEQTARAIRRERRAS